MYLDNIVDVYLLESGIYEAAIPKLYSLNTTIESLMESYSEIDKDGEPFVSEKFFDNLRKCRMEIIELKV